MRMFLMCLMVMVPSVGCWPVRWCSYRDVGEVFTQGPAPSFTAVGVFRTAVSALLTTTVLVMRS